ncbi:hypothetical protein SISSUDRAFT_1045570 [Sistotremastrum suecicum HHB10207 ss-3]|uniref:Uncharacterized protein n=1 Tax=Sistotremastrum suecicum HHB10207 ss-3 TaxID=1314776 RepID=A0A166EBJ6_9AGAM|nr:hypothetical protein SISSUDRAFT_1045570 [Sistotremastrum suecicum HHB10207 ss-3]
MEETKTITSRSAVQAYSAPSYYATTRPCPPCPPEFGLVYPPRKGKSCPGQQGLAVAGVSALAVKHLQENSGFLLLGDCAQDSYFQADASIFTVCSN